MRKPISVRRERGGLAGGSHQAAKGKAAGRRKRTAPRQLARSGGAKRSYGTGRPLARRSTVRLYGRGGAAAGWRGAVTAAGIRYGRDHPPAGAELRSHLQMLWCSYWFSSEARHVPPASFTEAAKAFLNGYRIGAGVDPGDFVPLPTKQTVGAVVTAMNEEAELPGVLKQLERLPLNETIVVVNGSTDSTFRLARADSRAIVVSFAERLGHDVGRAIGAKLAVSDILLFLDGDVPVAAEKLASFVHAVEQGTDVALNDITPFIGLFRQRDGVTVVKEFLNRSLGRPDLKANSLTAVPHALSRRAVQSLGYSSMAVPPKAQALAIRKGLRVRAPVSVDVITRNKIRMGNSGPDNPVARLILGDHVEALRAVMDQDGSRLTYSDGMRRRNIEELR